MRAKALNLSDVFAFEQGGGEMTFAGERVVLMDAVALGLLRQQLITAFGKEGARGVLSRFGYSHGWRMAEAMRQAIPWDDEREWRVAGGRLHRLHGMVTFEPVASSTFSPPPFAEAIWPDSYEADQHLMLLGRSDTCACWTLCGFASGYLSYVNGRTIYCVEETCRARGDAVCHMVGRFKDDWPAEKQAELTFYETDCLESGLRNLQRSLKRVDRRLQQRRALHDAEVQDGGLVARSQAMKKLLVQAARVAGVDTTVLLLGESGVGKERLARLIHEKSRRAAGPFVAINCAAVPESLLESELFGHARGAFTGAVSERAGLFEAAKGGTLLLDEVGEIPLPMQAKLLRVLQERQVRRLGENAERHVDARVIGATHRDLKQLVAEGRFREDLAYRLRVIELSVPPLRERVDDVVPLARLALASALERAKLPPLELSAPTVRALLDYAWPGNVRELFNAIERAAVLASGRKIEPEDLPPEVTQRSTPRRAPGTAQTLAELEREWILATLAQEGGNRARTAAKLAIGQATLFRKIKQYQQEGYLIAPAA